MPAGSSARMRLYCRKIDKRIGIVLKFTRSELGDRVYERLFEERKTIDEDLGVPVEWITENDQHRVDAFQPIPDIRDPQHREQMMDFLEDHANRFVNAFRTRIQRIVEEL